MITWWRQRWEILILSLFLAGCGSLAGTELSSSPAAPPGPPSTPPAGTRSFSSKAEGGQVGSVVSDVLVSLRAGWNAVGFQSQLLTALNASGEVTGQATWNGASYLTGNFDRPALNALGGRRGFWVFAQSATSFTYSGGDDGQGAFVELTLPGYNLVSFATSADIPGSLITAVQNNQAVDLPTLVLPQFFELGPDNEYTVVDIQKGGVIKPGRAYWIFANLAQGAVKLTWTTLAPSPSPSPAPSASPAASPSPGLDPSPTPIPSVSPAGTSPVATSLAITSQPSTVASGTAFNFLVTVRDQFGKTFTGAPVSVALGVQSGPAGATFTTAPMSGTGTITLPRAFDKAGVYQVVASASGLTSALSNPITVTAGGAARLAFSIQPAPGNVSQPLALLQVQAQDAAGNPVNSGGTSIELTGTAGTVAGSPVSATITGANSSVNVTTLTVTTATAAMNLTANATAASGLAPATSTNFAVATGGSNKLVFSAPSFPQTLAAGTTQPVTVQIRSLGDVLDSSATNSITLSLRSGPTGATLQPGLAALTTSASGGQASFNLSLALPGVYELSASASGFAPISTPAAALNVTPGAAASLRFVVQPAVTGQVSVSTASYRVEILDALGNRKTDATGLVSFTLASGLGELFLGTSSQPVQVPITTSGGNAGTATLSGRLPVGQPAAVVSATFGGLATVLANPVRVLQDAYKHGNLIAAAATLNGLPGLSDDSRWQVYVQSGQVYRRDRFSGAIVLISAQDGTAGVMAGAACSDPKVSDDGDRVVFSSAATNLVGGFGGGAHDNIYLRTVSTQHTLLVSRATAGPTTGGDAASQNPHLSADGTKVGFETLATTLNTGNALLTGSTTRQVMLATIPSGTAAVSGLTVASVNTTTPARADADCSLGGMSSMGSRLVFRSNASNLNGTGVNQAFGTLLSGSSVSSVIRVAAGISPGSLPTVSDTGQVAYLNTATPPKLVIAVPGGPATILPLTNSLVAAGVPVLDRTGSFVLLNYTGSPRWRVVRLADNTLLGTSNNGNAGTSRGLLTSGAAWVGYWTTASNFVVEPGP